MDDLKIIKKKYGEKMMQLCRELFSTIIEKQPGMLAKILLEKFAPNKKLYDDLMSYDQEANFKDYIYSIYENLKFEKKEPKTYVEDPVTLMRQAGYTLYECKCEEDIQKFKRYYARGEELCTFKDKRLNKCYVYFAVRDGADMLKRAKFTSPRRQDEYGTSVISIQFTRDPSHTLSIKNRYNHTVVNPDATYANNLDGIVKGLTQSFEDYYGLKQRYPKDSRFEMPGYVCADDGKFYKYNYEINNVYYCPGNIIIDNFKVYEYPHEKYLVVDYFLFDFVNKKIISRTSDSFPMTIGDIKRIDVKNDGQNKNVIIVTDDENVIIVTVNSDGKIIGYKNNKVTVIPDNFLNFNSELQHIEITGVKEIGNYFLPNNRVIESLTLPSVLRVGDNFMEHSNLKEIEMPLVKTLGKYFLAYNFTLKKLELPEVIDIKQFCLLANSKIEAVILPKVEKIDDYSFNCLLFLNLFYAPNVKKLPLGWDKIKILQNNNSNSSNNRMR